MLSHAAAIVIHNDGYDDNPPRPHLEVLLAEQVDYSMYVAIGVGNEKLTLKPTQQSERTLDVASNRYNMV